MIDDLEHEIEVMLSVLKLNYRKISIIKKTSVQYLIEDFGVIICGMERLDYGSMKEIIERDYEGWRAVYLTVHDDVSKEREKIIWELSRSGYLKWVRLKFPRQFNNFIIMEGFGKKIINERLKIWNGRNKYKFLIEDNEDALRQSETYLLSVEPSFYDYIPERI